MPVSSLAIDEFRRCIQRVAGASRCRRTWKVDMYAVIVNLGDIPRPPDAIGQDIHGFSCIDRHKMLVRLLPVLDLSFAEPGAKFHWKQGGSMSAFEARHMKIQQHQSPHHACKLFSLEVMQK